MDTYLFIDTTHGQTLGLFNANDWIYYTRDAQAKTSESLHANIYQVLKTYDLNIHDLKATFTCAGPGSYTGMRVGEGLSQILEWHGIPVHRFYLHLLPKIFGVENGTWLSKAFKGEYFLFQWDQEENQSRLIKKQMIDQNIQYWSTGDLSEDINSLNIYDSLKQFIPKKFHLLQNDIKSNQLLYYRSLEQEFKKTT